MTKDFTANDLIVATSLFFMMLGNQAFFSNVFVAYPLKIENLAFLASLFVTFTCANVIVLSLLCFRFTIKPILITLLVLSSMAAYFMDTYNIVISHEMVDNILQTDSSETYDLWNVKQAAYLLLLGILPSILVYRARLVFHPLRRSILSRVFLLGFSIATIVSLALLFGSHYASFFREHKTLRFYANPSYFLYSINKYVNLYFDHGNSEIRQIGLDAKTPVTDMQRELIIFVVGETVRSDHMSLNGYARKTNPNLENEAVYSFDNFWSCGTSTSMSVPCMFSQLTRDNYDKYEAKGTENVLDLLVRSGVNVVWLDNNSDSKGVAERVTYVDYRSSEVNPICDAECRDEGMLANLQDYIDSHPSGDIFIVLHQMGNHGPAYFKRYPPSFEKFKPTCNTNMLEQCSQLEITNTYDNAVLYTDHFLSETVALLKRNDGVFEAALLYVSDHGESLGENGLYLHGLPYAMAPDTQIHVPVVMWFGEHFDKTEIDFQKLDQSLSNKYSHDNIFHTILGLFEVETDQYNPELDIVSHEPSEIPGG